MPASKRNPTEDRLTDDVLALCWGAWAELGVSGWARTHQDWAIDPEPLVVFTASLGDLDPRLRDESLDWCIHYSRFVSRARLKNLRSHATDLALADAWGEFSATVNARARAMWTGATHERESYRVTGRSMIRPLTEASLVVLRMRAMFGLGARAEILRHLLLREGTWATTAQLAASTFYTKRNVAQECEALELAGVLAMRSDSNRFYYSLAQPRTLAAFVGDLPSVRPDWRALFRVVASLMALDRAAAGLADEVLTVETHRVVRDIERDLDILGLPGPPKIRGADSWDGFRSWATLLLRDLGAGRWPAEQNSEHAEPPIQRA